MMPRWCSRLEACRKELELRFRRTPLHLHLGTSSHPRHRSGEGTLRWPCPLCHGPSAIVAPQPTSPEPLGSQEPPALSQKVPLLVMHLAVRQVGTPEVEACSEVPVDQRVVGRCSCVRYGEYEPSII
jgi:hypothetical protein